MLPVKKCQLQLSLVTQTLCLGRPHRDKGVTQLQRFSLWLGRVLKLIGIALATPFLIIIPFGIFFPSEFFSVLPFAGVLVLVGGLVFLTGLFASPHDSWFEFLSRPQWRPDDGGSGESKPNNDTEQEKAENGEH